MTTTTLRFHVEYVDPALEGEDVELEIVDPSAILLDESGTAGPMLAALKLRGPVRKVERIRPERPNDDRDLGRPRNRLERSVAA